jgi:hypothetical protein
VVLVGEEAEAGGVGAGLGGLLDAGGAGQERRREAAAEPVLALALGISQRKREVLPTHRQLGHILKYIIRIIRNTCYNRKKNTHVIE